MPRSQRGMVSLRFERVPFRLGADGLPPERCPNCSGHLDYVQPDQFDPDRLIGTCGNCRDWYLVEISSEEETVEFLELPSRSARSGSVLTTRWPESVESRSVPAGS
ncbi:hypothetical protein [Tautonia sociabilis]|uniref:Transcription factor zinc-finger domain-containing protein n=1 Tax=Tautonia sociabilis TaxID=2080755 RepID=A0A432MKI8_9BACT|nr:hypothetical protein [Tautonia sociabilis]RUL87727.1 hypothetical protein TsocGM_11115 [Tautonia sociabilis]